MSRVTGPFIYKGSGKKQSESATPEQKKCVKEACNIQYCLAKYQYQQKRCDEVITIWKNCCEKAKASTSNNTSTNDS